MRDRPCDGAGENSANIPRWGVCKPSRERPFVAPSICFPRPVHGPASRLEVEAPGRFIRYIAQPTGARTDRGGGNDCRGPRCSPDRSARGSARARRSARMDPSGDTAVARDSPRVLLPPPAPMSRCQGFHAPVPGRFSGRWMDDDRGQLAVLTADTAETAAQSGQEHRPRGRQTGTSPGTFSPRRRKYAIQQAEGGDSNFERGKSMSNQKAA